MKKILSALLVAVMLLSLCALAGCGSCVSRGGPAAQRVPRSLPPRAAQRRLVRSLVRAIPLSWYGANPLPLARLANRRVSSLPSSLPSFPACRLTGCAAAFHGAPKARPERPHEKSLP